MARPSARTEMGLGLSFLCIMGVVICVDSDGETLLRWFVQGLFAFGVLAMLMSKLGFWWGRFQKLDDQKTPVPQRNPSLEAEKMKEARVKTQKKHDALTEKYREQVIKPREEAKLKKQEEELQRMQGSNWKGKGQKLGKVKLPAEPEEGAEGCVTVALRDPEGVMHQRRFTQDNKIQSLLDYMTLLGFHQSSYTIATSYPRQLLHDKSDCTLGDCGLSSRVSLNMELREDEN